ncbi:MAG TPA: MlaD family protein [Gemmatimonadales bacterium]
MLTSGVLEGRYSLIMRMEQAEGISQDTRVMLQGLEIGRVTTVNPQRDSTSGTLTFLATLSVRERFPDGTRLSLPTGTSAAITQAGVLGGTVIQLKMPDRVIGVPDLQPDDTIRAERTPSTMDALGDIAARFREDVAATLEETKTLLQETTRLVATTRGAIDVTTPQLMEVMDRLAENLNRTDHILAELSPRVGPIADSISVTVGSTRTLVMELQTLVASTNAMTNENRDAITSIVASFDRTAQILAHFADQVSRRPLRLLTGVKPADTTNR